MPAAPNQAKPPRTVLNYGFIRKIPVFSAAIGHFLALSAATQMFKTERFF
jgi:hypothetical protein